MKRAYNLEMDDVISSKVSLVERNGFPSGIPLVNSRTVAKKSPDDLVELAREIQKADTFIHANACNKLQIIAQQVRFLQQQAQDVLKEAKTQLDLHHVACNFVKTPGNIYYLYKRPSGQNYFGMLSPTEWTNCPHEFLGGFRLEFDHSWTPIENIEKKNYELMMINKILDSDKKEVLSHALSESAMEF